MSSGARRSPLERIGVVPIGCVIGLTILLAIGGLAWNSGGSLGHAAKPTARNAGVVPDASGPTGSASSRRSGTTPAVALSPTRIEIPKLHTEAPIIDVATMPNGELEIPQNPRTVGWWSPGARPGATKGTAVIAGHINYSGVTGAFADIGQLDPGDQIRVFGSTLTAGGKSSDTFTVAAVRTYHKTSLPYQQIFDQSIAGRLALVTCGGPFDAATGNYLDNIVVYAVPA